MGAVVEQDRIEARLEHLQSDISDIKADVRESLVRLESHDLRLRGLEHMKRWFFLAALATGGGGTAVAEMIHQHADAVKTASPQE